MPQIITYFIAGFFAALLFLNLFFRWKVIKIYKNLVNKKVEFKSVDILKSDKKMAVVYATYPDSVEDIKRFIRYIRISVGMAVLIVLLITLLGYFLHISS
ncbi:MAG: hypothetical protein WAT79_03375 [Saprospiraceae bacterium]